MELFLSFRELLPRQSSGFASFRRLVRASWFPVLLCLAFLSAAVVVGHTKFSVESFNAMRFIPVLILFAIGMILLFDALARINDYIYYSSTNRVANSLRLLTNLRKSFCSRQVAIALYGKTARKFYHTLGYRWYHIFPDDVFCRRSALFRREFWRAVLRGRN